MSPSSEFFISVIVYFSFKIFIWKRKYSVYLVHFIFFAETFSFSIYVQGLPDSLLEHFYNSCFKALLDNSDICVISALESFSMWPEIPISLHAKKFWFVSWTYWILHHESLSFVYILGKRWYFCFSLWWAVGSYVSSFFRFCSTNCNCPAYTPSCGQPDTWVKIYLLVQFLKSLVYKLLSNTCMSVSHWFRSS